ncbi:hypothetical protein [Vacuolonema iberomarrocanum]|nr:hypothetical protein [filamentous cyanobacterium LEGE 07170]
MVEVRCGGWGDRSSPNILRVLAIGSLRVVSNFMLTMFQLGYARPEKWSR